MLGEASTASGFSQLLLVVLDQPLPWLDLRYFDQIGRYRGSQCRSFGDKCLNPGLADVGNQWLIDLQLPASTRRILV